jgi:hypothetical protein
MRRADKQQVISILVKAGRTDLADFVARTGTQRVHAMHPFVGKDVWGKYAMFHCYNGSITLEEYAPEKPRGKQTGVFVLMWMASHGEIPEPVEAILKQLIADIKSKPFAQLVSTLKAGVASQSRNFAIHLQADERKRKAIEAPSLVEHLGMPKEFENGKKVKVSISHRDRQVVISDLADKANEPRCMTQGPQAFQRALETYNQWKDLDFHGIMDTWGKLKIKSHYWCAMD